MAVGDKLLAIDGHSCMGIDHDTAVSILKSSQNAVTLRVEHNAFHKSAWEVSKALGLPEAPQPRVRKSTNQQPLGAIEAVAMSLPCNPCGLQIGTNRMIVPCKQLCEC